MGRLISGIEIADQVRVDSHDLVLNGAAVRRRFVAKMYIGALYLPAKTSNAAAIIAADAPRHMVARYLIALDRGRIVEEWADGLEANAPNASSEARTAFATLLSWMPDMKQGQEIAITYVPGAGTTVMVAGQPKGTLDGKAVADAILTTWIGPAPGPGADFKKAILGQ